MNQGKGHWSGRQQVLIYGSVHTVLHFNYVCHVPALFMNNLARIYIPIIAENVLSVPTSVIHEGRAWCSYQFQAQVSFLTCVKYAHLSYLLNGWSGQFDLDSASGRVSCLTEFHLRLSEYIGIISITSSVTQWLWLCCTLWVHWTWVCFQ
jgi:hypothetical protein